MRHIAALLLAQLGGNENPTAADIEKILSSVGIEADAARLSKLLEEIKGKNVAELMAEGRGMLASVPTAGVAVAGGAGAAAEAQEDAAPKEEEKEEEEESDDDMGFGLFD